jgi:DNA-binding NarL/FixJ family response regulator
MSITVLLVDDHAEVRAWIRRALDKATGLLVVGEAANGEEALRLVEQMRPDVILLDCKLPVLAGPQVAEAIRDRQLPTRVLALSAFTDDEYVEGMLRVGAVGYVLKDEALENVASAVRAVARGEEWYSQGVMDKVAAWAGNRDRAAATRGSSAETSGQSQR